MIFMSRYNKIMLLIFILMLILNPCTATRGVPSTASQPGHQQEIASRLDLGDPIVMRTAVTMARDYPGEFSINQVSAIYRELVEEKAWNYFNDPSFQDYYKYANETLEDGKRAGTGAVGDCDDFAILIASLIESLGGNSRIIFAQDEETGLGHAYAQLYIGDDGDPIVIEIEKFIKDEWGAPYVPGLSRSDDNSLWLNLDYNATYPGGFVFGGEKAIAEVAWISGNRTSPKIVPLIDSMDSMGSWEVIKDDVGSNISIKNVVSKKGKAIEMTYELEESGFVGMSRNVDSKVLAELEGINFTYRMTNKPVILELILSDESNTDYNISWTLVDDSKESRPMWNYLEGYYDNFMNSKAKEANFSQEILNRTNLRKIKFVIHGSPELGNSSRNGILAIDQIRGVLKIPKDSIWSQVKSERDRALAVQQASESEILRSYPAKILQSVQMAVQSLSHYQTLEGYLAIRRGLSLLPGGKAQLLHNDSVSVVAFSPNGSMLATGSDDKTARIWDGQTGIELQRLEHDGSVMAVAFSPDGSKLATASDDNNARIWDVLTGNELQRLEHDGLVRVVAFSPDGSKLATASDDNNARIWDVLTGNELQKLKHNDPVWTVAFNSDGNKLATGSKDHSACIWDVQTGKELQKLEHDSIVWTVAFSPDSNMLATGCDNKTVRLWDVQTGIELKRMTHDRSVYEIAFSPDGGKLATGSGDRTARLWDVKTGNELLRLKHDFWVLAAAFSPDGRRLATGSGDNTARLWDAENGKELLRMQHASLVNAVAFSPDGRRLATGSSDNSARLWDVEKSKELHKLEHNGSVKKVAFSPDGRMLATGSVDGTARLWDVENDKEILNLWHDAEVWGVAFSPDGRKLATWGSAFSGSGSMLYTSSPDNPVWLWDVESGKELQRLDHDNRITSAAFSPDGSMLATGSLDVIARLWDVKTGKEMQRLEHDNYVLAVAFSPDSSMLATGCDEGKSAQLWDAKTGKELLRLEHDSSVNAVAFSSDGRWLATGSGDTAQLWDIETGKVLQRLKHDGSVLAVAFSPDGRWLATGSDDRTARLWEVQTGKELQRLEHDESVNSVAFSPDGRSLATACNDQFARIWALYSEDMICEACSRLECNLTTSEWRAQYCRECDGGS